METLSVNQLLSEKHITAFINMVGGQNVLRDDESLDKYAHDETEDLYYLPDVVLKPGTAEEVSAILVFCNDHKIPVTPRGAGTGLSGGALPHLGGVVLSTERHHPGG
jgi:glycolate oxidase